MRILAIAKRILLELLRDKRTLALIFLAPILIMWLMNVMFSANNETNVDLATVNVPQQVNTSLNNFKGVTVHKYGHQQTAEHQFKDDKVDGIVHYKNNEYDVVYANTDASKTTVTKQALKSALYSQTILNMHNKIQLLSRALPVSTNSQLAVSQHQNSPKITNHYQYGDSNTNFFAKIIPILMGFFIFFFVFLISGIGLLDERTSGTLGRLLATPVKRSEIVFGYMLSYGLLAIFQTIVIVMATIWLLKVEVVGSIINIILISLLFALVALAFGILMSTLASSEFQMIQFIPLIVVPQVFFSGIIPLNSMATWVQYIGKVLPLTYAGDALTKITMNGTRLTALSNDILALFVFLIILTILNIIGLKRYRKV